MPINVACSRCIVTGAAAALMLCSAIVNADDSERFTAGTTLTYMPEERFRVAPGFADLDAYKAFVMGCRNNPNAALARSWKAFAGATNGDRVQVQAYLAPKDLQLPAATIRVTLRSGSHSGQTAWFPAVCFRPRVDPMPEGEKPLPEYGFVRNDKHRPVAGETLFIHSPTASKVYATTDIFAHRDKVRFVKAGDKRGLAEMLVAKRLLLVDAMQQILVVEFHGDNELVNANEPVVEGRVMGGAHEGRLVWIAAHETGEYAVTALAVGSEALASKALARASAVEKSGRKAPALKLYRDIVRDYPDSAAAVKAKARVKALSR